MIEQKKLDEDFDIDAWKQEFDFANPDPRENSDFDSDNEIQ